MNLGHATSAYLQDNPASWPFEFKIENDSLIIINLLIRNEKPFANGKCIDLITCALKHHRIEMIKINPR